VFVCVCIFTFKYNETSQEISLGLLSKSSPQ